MSIVAERLQEIRRRDAYIKQQALSQFSDDENLPAQDFAESGIEHESAVKRRLREIRERDAQQAGQVPPVQESVPTEPAGGLTGAQETPAKETPAPIRIAAQFGRGAATVVPAVADMMLMGAGYAGKAAGYITGKTNPAAEALTESDLAGAAGRQYDKAAEWAGSKFGFQNVAGQSEGILEHAADFAGGGGALGVLGKLGKAAKSVKATKTAGGIKKAMLSGAAAGAGGEIYGILTDDEPIGKIATQVLLGAGTGMALDSRKIRAAKTVLDAESEITKGIKQLRGGGVNITRDIESQIVDRSLKRMSANDFDELASTKRTQNIEALNAAKQKTSHMYAKSNEWFDRHRNAVGKGGTIDAEKAYTGLENILADTSVGDGGGRNPLDGLRNAVLGIMDKIDGGDKGKYIRQLPKSIGGSKIVSEESIRLKKNFPDLKKISDSDGLDAYKALKTWADKLSTNDPSLANMLYSVRHDLGESLAKSTDKVSAKTFKIANRQYYKDIVKIAKSEAVKAALEDNSVGIDVISELITDIKSASAIERAVGAEKFKSLGKAKLAELVTSRLLDAGGEINMEKAGLFGNILRNPNAESNYIRKLAGKEQYDALLGLTDVAQGIVRASKNIDLSGLAKTLSYLIATVYKTPYGVTKLTSTGLEQIFKSTKRFIIESKKREPRSTMMKTLSDKIAKIAEKIISDSTGGSHVALNVLAHGARDREML